MVICTCKHVDSPRDTAQVMRNVVWCSYCSQNAPAQANAGRSQACEILVKAGADVNAQCDKGYTALHEVGILVCACVCMYVCNVYTCL